jgi:hypothetical protein
MKYKNYNAEWEPFWFFGYNPIDEEQAEHLFNKGRDLLILRDPKNTTIENVMEGTLVKTDENISFDIMTSIFFEFYKVRIIEYNQLEFAVVKPSNAYISLDVFNKPVVEIPESIEIETRSEFYSDNFIKWNMIREFEIREKLDPKLIYALDKIYFLKSVKKWKEQKAIDYVGEQSGIQPGYLKSRLQSRRSCLRNWKKYE